MGALRPLSLNFKIRLVRFLSSQHPGNQENGLGTPENKKKSFAFSTPELIRQLERGKDPRRRRENMYQLLQSHPSRSTEKRSSLFRLPQLFFRFVVDITYSQFLVYLHQIFGEREPDWAFHFFHHLHISYMTEDSDQHGAGGKLGTRVSVVMIMLNLHHCLLKSHVYMSLDWVLWGVRCGYVQQSYQTAPTERVFFGLLCTRCPVLHFFLLPWGMEVAGEMGWGVWYLREPGNHERISPRFQPFDSRL